MGHSDKEQLALISLGDLGIGIISGAHSRCSLNTCRVGS